MHRIESNARVFVAHRGDQAVDDDGRDRRGAANQRTGLERVLRRALRPAKAQDAGAANAIDQEEPELGVDRRRLHAIVGIENEGGDRLGGGKVAGGAKLLGRFQPDLRIRMTKVPNDVLPARLGGGRRNGTQARQADKNETTSRALLRNVAIQDLTP